MCHVMADLPGQVPRIVTGEHACQRSHGAWNLAETLTKVVAPHSLDGRPRDGSGVFGASVASEAVVESMT
jgi:hypothetical protein